MSRPATSLYIASVEGGTGKSLVALGLVNVLVGHTESLGVFRPVTCTSIEDDELVAMLREHTGGGERIAAKGGVTYDEVHRDPHAALTRIVESYQQLQEQCDMVVVVGSDYTDVASPTEFEFNGQIAANLGSQMVVVARGDNRSLDEITQIVDIATTELKRSHATIAAVVANRCDPDSVNDVKSAIRELGYPAWAFPEVPLLSTPPISDVMTALGGELLLGDDTLLTREAESTVMCGMSVEHVLDRLQDGALCVATGDRPGVILAIAAAHAAAGHPSIASLVLNGGFRPKPAVVSLLEGLNDGLPIIVTGHDSYNTARIANGVKGRLARGSRRKIDTALSVFSEHVATEDVLRSLALERPTVTTPLMFESMLIDRARDVDQHIVLPEGNDDRILQAASTLLARKVVRLTILGDDTSIRSRASSLGLDLDAANIIDPLTSDLRAGFAAEYAQLRAHKGITVEGARDIMKDVSYFATMMVHTGQVDAMVSGAAHSTAHTITPSFEIIKTAPGFDIVSSVFFMSLQDRVLVYGDCAINPDPSADDLADIAVASAETAQLFGIEPRVAMLSYSTGSSGSGSDVDKIRHATELVKTRAPDLLVEGPLQYDAAVDTSVAAKKMPGSSVAGSATVFIFPDLNAGNNTYKAVQRSAGAVAIGPVLQGLNKPVNDLSRGATVRDIINTISITAAQAAGGQHTTKVDPS